MALNKATIINLDTREAISVLFNPEEYTLDVGNTIAEIGIPGQQKSPVQYVRGNVRTLRMELFFDTYEQNEDVRIHTRRITALLEPGPTTLAPPVLLFSWSSLQFQCVLETVSQRFVMFKPSGMPVRARLTVAFKEFARLEVQIERGFFIGPPTIRNLIEGETLSQLAYEYLGDAGAWREIAEANGIDDPLNLPAGRQIVIPSGRTRRGI
jgi:Contractile injection system tube protein/LysM domain